ncbi:MAG: SDR family oxidoreductase [Pseudomonadota bacterium]
MTKIDENYRANYGPWALVTGASNGIGLEIAKILAAKGMNVALVARRAQHLTEISKSLQAGFGIEARALPADLSSKEELRALLDQIEALDIGLYVANAGFGSSGPFAASDISHELNMIDVNCRALTELAHPLAQTMKQRGRGGMIFLSSIVSFQGVGNSTTYAASKAYVQSFAEGLAIELGRFGVDVLSSAPGPVATGFATRAGMQVSGAASPVTVAKATVSALGRVRTTRPGFLSKLMGYGLAILPRRLRSRILTSVMSGMTKHRDETQKN